MDINLSWAFENWKHIKKFLTRLHYPLFRVSLVFWNSPKRRFYRIISRFNRWHIFLFLAARCRHGWIQYGHDCLLLSSEIIQDSSGDPKESCKRHGAKAFQIENTGFCFLKFVIHNSAALILFEFNGLFSWHHEEPLENCTSLENMYKNGIVYSRCNMRIYFACVQSKELSLPTIY